MPLDSSAATKKRKKQMAAHWCNMRVNRLGSEVNKACCDHCPAKCILLSHLLPCYSWPAESWMWYLELGAAETHGQQWHTSAHLNLAQRSWNICLSSQCHFNAHYIWFPKFLGISSVLLKNILRIHEKISVYLCVAASCNIDKQEVLDL